MSEIDLLTPLSGVTKEQAAAELALQDKSLVETGSPLNAAPGASAYSTFGEFVMDPNGTTVHQFASVATSIYHATSTDGVTWTWDAVSLAPNASQTWENVAVGVPTVWCEAGTWYMLYRGVGTVTTVNQIGLATAPSASGPWTRAQAGPVVTIALAKLPDVEPGPGRLIKVGSTYYLHASSIVDASRRRVVVLTSTDLINWTRDNENPIWDGGRFCNCIWKAGDYYYSLVPAYVNGLVAPAVIELWRSTSPRFEQRNREYVGVAINTGPAGSWSEKCLDTPTVLVTDIHKDTYPAFTGGQPWVYFAGQELASGDWRSGLTKLTTNSPLFRGRWNGPTRYAISTLGSWAIDTPATTRAFGYIFRLGDATQTRKYVTLPRSCSIVGISLTTNNARTAGTATASVVDSDGTALVGLSATLDATNPTTVVVMTEKGLKPRAPGAQIGVGLSTASFSSAGGPGAASFAVDVFVAYNPY